MTAPPDLPSWQGAANARTLVGPALRALYRIGVSGLDRVPRDGPLLLVANHPGALDGPVLAATAPRPVHVLSDQGDWPPPLDRWSRAVGEIEVRPGLPDRTALHRAAAALADDRAVACFPEGGIGAGDVRTARPGVGYLLARREVPVVPVALFGTRGRHPMDPPRPRARLLVAYGTPVAVPVGDVDPLRRADLLRLTERVRQVLADHVDACARRTGRTPAGDVLQDGQVGAAAMPGRRGA